MSIKIEVLSIKTICVMKMGFISLIVAASFTCLKKASKDIADSRK